MGIGGNREYRKEMSTSYNIDEEDYNSKNKYTIKKWKLANAEQNIQYDDKEQIIGLQR